jgi:hypothetical protein
MRSKRHTIPGMIFLPGPVVAAYTVTVTGRTNDYAGRDIEVEQSFAGDGRGEAQVIEAMNDDYSRWYPLVGEEITIDYGRGSIKRVLAERFGELFFDAA